MIFNVPLELVIGFDFEVFLLLRNGYRLVRWGPPHRLHLVLTKPDEIDDMYLDLGGEG